MKKLTVYKPIIFNFIKECLHINLILYCLEGYNFLFFFLLANKDILYRKSCNDCYTDIREYHIHVKYIYYHKNMSYTPRLVYSSDTKIIVHVIKTK